MTKAGAQRMLDRQTWRNRVKLLVKLYPRTVAAQKLGVSDRQLRRYCVELGLEDGRSAKGSDTTIGNGGNSDTGGQ